jgi:hypothetical protein
MPATFGSRGEVLMAAAGTVARAAGARPKSAGSLGGCPDGRAGSRRTVFESLRGRELGGGRRAGAEALSCMGTWRGCLGRRAMVRVGPDATENPLARPHTRVFK